MEISSLPTSHTNGIACQQKELIISTLVSHLPVIGWAGVLGAVMLGLGLELALSGLMLDKLVDD